MHRKLLAIIGLCVVLVSGCGSEKVDATAVSQVEMSENPATAEADQSIQADDTKDKEVRGVGDIKVTDITLPEKNVLKSVGDLDVDEVEVTSSVKVDNVDLTLPMSIKSLMDLGWSFETKDLASTKIEARQVSECFTMTNKEYPGCIVTVSTTNITDAEVKLEDSVAFHMTVSVLDAEDSDIYPSIEYNGVTLGMSADEVVSKLGKPESDSEFKSTVEGIENQRVLSYEDSKSGRFVRMVSYDDKGVLEIGVSTYIN